MIKSRIRKIETIKYRVHVSGGDIEEGECLKAHKCMVRVANERALRSLDPSMPNHHSRVDAGHIKFNYKGRYAIADTPRVAKAKLIQFDKEVKEKRKAKQVGKPFKSEVEPFGFIVCAVLGRKIIKTTRERKDKINEARKRRQAAGQKPKQYTLHQRVVGFA